MRRLGPVRSRVWRRLSAVAVTLCAFVCLGLTPGPAHAADGAQGPWSKGTIRPAFGFGFGYSRDVVSLGFGLGANYFVWHGLSLGLGLSDQILIYSSDLKGRLPDVENQIPTNVFRITPSAQYVFLRRPRFSPYVAAGVGPTFFNNGNGTFGHWTAGPGAYIWLAGPVYLDLGVSFSGMFPTESCNDAFIYEPAGQPGFRVFDDYCSFRWGPQVGIVLAFGGSSSRGAQRRRQRREERERQAVPPDNPLGEPERVSPSPAPAPQPVSPAPTEPAEPEPSEPPVVGPEPPPQPAEDAPPPGPAPSPSEEDLATPPAEPPPEPEPTTPPPDDAPPPTDVAPPPGDGPGTDD